MTDSPVLRSGQARLLSAELRGDEREWRRLRDVVRGEGGWDEVAPAAFGLAARWRFGEYPDLRVVALFVRRFLERAPGAESFLPRDVEAVIRVVTGDEYLDGGGGPGCWRIDRVRAAVCPG